MDDSSQPTLKIGILLASVVCAQISLSPPNPPVHKEECCPCRGHLSTFFQSHVGRIMFFTKTMVCMAVAIELNAMFLHHTSRGTAWQQWNCVSPGSAVTASGDYQWATRCSPWVVVSVVLIVVGTILRVWSFRALGPLFTFEVSIQPEHKLITSGPYAWVRHPSYSSGFAFLLGVTLLFLTPEATWVKSCGIPTWPGLLFLAAWCAVCTIILAATFARLHTEDQMLKETFGKEWDVYREKVPFLLVPCLI